MDIAARHITRRGQSDIAAPPTESDPVWRAVLAEATHHLPRERRPTPLVCT